MANPIEQRWCELWEKLGARGNPRMVFARLKEAYSEPHRAYHNLQHIQECLDTLEAAKSLASSPEVLALAIWFHDFVYDTHRADNEEQSAALLQKVADEQGIADSLANGACELVLATKSHSGTGHPDIALMIDIDLKILGETSERFTEYEQQIRREYEWVPRDVFASKRAEILERFLERPFIYNTDFFRARYEATARLNLQQSMELLRKATI